MRVVLLEEKWVPGAVALQRACFPPPFPEDLLWSAEDLQAHLAVFPEGQFVALDGDTVIGSASNLRISEGAWHSHLDWEGTTGGHRLAGHDPEGSTLYGADISVHPAHRGRGVARALYGARYSYVREHGLARYGTACRIPDWQAWANLHQNFDKSQFVRFVIDGKTVDRTLTPLLRLGLQVVTIIDCHMKDEESGDAAVALEWMP